MVYQRPLRSDELMHFGIKGMHWGVRRYQNEDGSYTAAGREHYGIGAAYKKATGMQNAYHSKATRKYEQRYGKDSAEAKASRELDRKITEKRRDEIEHEAGKTAVKNMLAGSTMKKTYDMARAAGLGRGESIARSVLDINGGTIAALVVGSAIVNPIGTALVPVAGAAVQAGAPAAAAYTGARLASRAVGNVVGRGVEDVITKGNYKGGSEWSLQQQAIRKKYVKKALAKRR